MQAGRESAHQGEYLVKKEMAYVPALSGAGKQPQQIDSEILRLNGFVRTSLKARYWHETEFFACGRIVS